LQQFSLDSIALVHTNLVGDIVGTAGAIEMEGDAEAGLIVGLMVGNLIGFVEGVREMEGIAVGVFTG
jgi:hypothetical protein